MLKLASDIDSLLSIHTQSERCHKNTTGYVKQTAKQVKSDLILQKGYLTSSFHISTINNVLNRLGYSLKKVKKCLPFKRIEETDALFENIAKHRKIASQGVLKLSLDCKDNLKVGALSRKGYHRQREDYKALDKDQQWDCTLIPFGILEIDSSQMSVFLGNSYETSDFMVDALELWYESKKNRLEQDKIHTLELYLDNGPNCSGIRTQFLNRLLEFVCITGLKIHLLYYPPYHSKYNPIERAWAALENYWSSTLLTSVNKVINTIQCVKWKNNNFSATLIEKVYKKGITLSEKQMIQRIPFIERNTELPKWDIWLKPSEELGRLFYI
jgi:Rhodopirellula transposase DDE domain